MSQMSTQVRSDSIDSMEPDDDWDDGQDKQNIASVALQAAATTTKKDRWVLLPEHSFVGRWDGIMSFMLLFTSTVTPYEVSFLETKVDPLFYVNRVVDFFFITDIVVQFHLSYFDEKQSRRITSLSKIRSRYLRGWFGMDVLSTVPFDLVGLFMKSDTVEQLKVLRILKLLKLLKLMRILKSMRIFKRVQASLGLSNSTASLVKFLVSVIMSIHWVACFWSLVPTLEDSEVNWISQLDPAREAAGEKIPTYELFVTAIEFAFMIMVMGYGTTAPTTSSERVFAILCMLIAGSIYAYAIGSICSVISMRDPATTKFQETMDLLLKYVDENNMPLNLRMRMHEYFVHCKLIIRNKFYQSMVLPSLAPSLRAEAAVFTQSEWADQIPFFCATNREERTQFVTQLTMKLEYNAYPPQETLYYAGEDAVQMYIVVSGLVRKGTTLLRKGQFFGEVVGEMLMRDAIRPEGASTITYADLSTLPLTSLMTVLQEGKRVFIETRKLVRSEQIRLTLKKVVREIGKAAIVMHKHHNKKYKRMNENELQAYQGYLAQKQQEHEKSRDPVKLAQSRARNQARLQELQAKRQPPSRLEQSQKLLEFWTPKQLWAKKRGMMMASGKLAAAFGGMEKSKAADDEGDGVKPPASFEDTQVTELQGLDGGADAGTNSKVVDYERLERFMSKQIIDAKIQLMRDMGMKLADVRSKVAANVSGMQKEVLGEFGPKFSALEKKFQRMDGMVQDVTRIVAELSEPKKRSRRRGGGHGE